MPELDRGYAEVKSGRLRGEVLPGGVKVFRGIPYAAAPVGELRWRPPEPPAEWRGVRDAFEFGYEAVQEGILNSLGPELGAALQPGVQLEPGAGNGALPISEDCLYLNIWTPAASTTEKLAVLVWIHGGSLQEGAGSNFLYNGASLAERGIVVVTINYRLGIFGFLAHPQLTRESGHCTSGNYGLLDQLAAIKWVRGNIAGFGGDAEKITVGGQSAGGLSAGALLASPLSEGLFRRAIIQSGPPFGLSEFYSQLGEEEKVGEKFLEEMKVKNISELREKSTGEIFEKSKVSGFVPRITVDGRFLEDLPGKCICSGLCRKVQLLLGGNSHEFSDRYSFEKGLEKENYLESVKKKYGPFSSRILELYPPGDSLQTARTAVRLEAHMLFAGARKTAKAVSEAGGDAYLYYFSREVSTDPGGFYGANHSAELPFLFRLENRGNIFPWEDRKWKESDIEFSDTLMSYWVNFIKSGTPNGQALPFWPEYGKDKAGILEFADTAKELTDTGGFNFEVFEEFMTLAYGL